MRPLPLSIIAILSAVAACNEPVDRPFSASPVPGFVDVGLASGLTASHLGGGPEKGYIIEAKGGGAAFIDSDNDGNLDIYLVNGATLENPEKGGGNILYRNDGQRGFVDVSEAMGVQGKGWGMGAASADYDNDGDADLYVTNLQENILYRNDGTTGFVDVAPEAGVATSHWSTGAAFADFDGDGLLDLYVANYAEFSPREIPRLGAQWKGVNVFVGPLGLRPSPDSFYRNNGDGTFSDLTEAAGLGGVEPGYGFGVLFADFDDDGDPDLYVANDSSPNFLFRNTGNSRFTEVALDVNTAYGELGNAQAGMGVARGDFDGNGYPDIFVTNFEDDYNTLYSNSGSGRFADVSFEAGLGKASLPYVGFGANFFDWDNDGCVDLFVANGHVYPQIEQAGSGTSYAQPNHFFKNKCDATFELVVSPEGAPSVPHRVSRGSMVGDYDNDGDLDLFITNLNDRPTLLRNEVGNRLNWLGVRLVGRASNRNGIGARLRLVAGGRVQIRDILSGSSFLCSEDPRAHFGLGHLSVVDSLEVRWPSGTIQHLTDLAVNRYLLIEEL